MRVRTSPIDPAYVYPCSRRDVKEAFGTELLESAWFGLGAEFEFDSRATHRPRISGFVPMHVSVNRQNEATLYLYRVKREDDSILLRSRLREIMRGDLRAWTERKVARTDTQVLGHEKLIVEVKGGLLLTQELRYL